MPDGRLLTPEQVAELLQVTAAAVRKWARDGTLRGLRIGRLWRFEWGAVEEFLGRVPSEKEVEQ